MPSRVTDLKRRRDYASQGTGDDFIVAILKAEIERFLTETVPRYGAPRVLDVGCGEQPFRPFIESLGGRYVGLDVQQNEQGNVDFRTSISDDLPASVRSQLPFEVGLCTEVLEHVLDWGVAFRNLAGLIAPRGRLLVTCPFVYPLHEEPHDYWRPTLHALGSLAEQHGFQVLDLRRVGGPWEVLATLLGHTRLSSRDRSAKARLALRVALLGRGRLAAWLRRGRLQSLLDATGSYYLSNVAVLERRDLVAL